MIGRTRAELALRDVRRPAQGRSGVDDVPAEDRAVVRFATFQLFVLLYLAKFAIGPAKFQISVPLLVMFAGLSWMIMLRRITFSPIRLGLFLIFVSCCLFSQLLVNKIGSIPSLLELLLIYGFMTTSAPLSEAGYRRVLNNFMKLMIVPAVIVIVQYTIQRITGHGDPISMNQMLPKSVLLQGYVYEANYPNWDSPFQRPNGFFFLEPSFVSLFTASAAIVELSFFRRPVFVLLMIAATALSAGGTGVTMLILASPFLLARESPRVVVPLVAIAIVAVVSAYMLGANLPLISRLNELDQTTVGATLRSSGSLRLIVPFTHLIEYLSDPSYLFTGAGAGSTGPDLGSPWPILKLTREYGVITMISFVAVFTSGFFGKYNVPLKVAAAVIFNFTGGYLLDVVTVEFYTILFCIIEPARRRNLELTSPIRPVDFGHRLQTGRLAGSPASWAGTSSLLPLQRRRP
jgi:hypothetical protein